MAILLVSLGSNQTFLPQWRTLEASLYCSLSVLEAADATAKGINFLYQIDGREKLLREAGLSEYSREDLT